MATSKENLAGFTGWLRALSDSDLQRDALHLASLSADDRRKWEVPGVDFWVDRDFQALRLIDEKRLSDLSTPGIERLLYRLQQPIQLIKTELNRRKRKGHPFKQDMWIVVAFYYELRNRGLDAANKFRIRMKVSERTLRRYRNNPSRDK